MECDLPAVAFGVYYPERDVISLMTLDNMGQANEAENHPETPSTQSTLSCSDNSKTCVVISRSARIFTLPKRRKKKRSKTMGIEVYNSGAYDNERFSDDTEDPTLLGGNGASLGPKQHVVSRVERDSFVRKNDGFSSELGGSDQPVEFGDFKPTCNVLQEFVNQAHQQPTKEVGVLGLVEDDSDVWENDDFSAELRASGMPVEFGGCKSPNAPQRMPIPANDDIVSAAISRNYEDKLQMYIGRGDELFSKKGALYTDASWYESTPEAIAKYFADRLANMSRRSVRVLEGAGYQQSSLLIAVDLFCGIGSDTIQLAQRFAAVIAVDICAEKIGCARHNAELYGVENKITFCCMDAVDFLSNEEVYLPLVTATAEQLQLPTPPSERPFGSVFISPPWGGPLYSAGSMHGFSLSDPMDVDVPLLVRLAARRALCVGMFLPRIQDLKELIELSTATCAQGKHLLTGGSICPLGTLQADVQQQFSKQREEDPSVARKENSWTASAANLMRSKLPMLEITRIFKNRARKHKSAEYRNQTFATFAILTSAVCSGEDYFAECEKGKIRDDGKYSVGPFLPAGNKPKRSVYQTLKDKVELYTIDGTSMLDLYWRPVNPTDCQ